MTDLALLEEQYRLHPYEPALRAQLIDEAMDALGLERPQAELRADIIQVAGVQQLQLAEATALLKKGSEFRMEIRHRARFAAGLVENEPITIVLTTGDCLTLFNQTINTKRRAFWSPITITIGAARILQWVDSMRYERANGIVPEYGYRLYRKPAATGA